ncbi:flavoprotein [Candidatus Lokiarchaeum ossiferum]|uniref:flavoprotein n=1 Tax=Candidatus Lokiarchaeum ossiferum TaxID=2951803 RepID=UPI00352BE6E2
MMKIAWGITGAGHQLKHNIEIIENLVQKGENIDLFISQAAEIVINMYSLKSRLDKIQKENPNQVKKIYYGRTQKPGFPICAKFNLGFYDFLVISPVTSNSVAKMRCGIADSLITNIFSQMIKGRGKILLVPTDIVQGKIQTEIPQGGTIEITIDEFNSKNANSLTKFPDTLVFSNPQEIMTYILEKKRLE